MLLEVGLGFLYCIEVAVHQDNVVQVLWVGWEMVGIVGESASLPFRLKKL